MTATLAHGLSPVRAELPNGATVLVQETRMTPAVTIRASLAAGSLYDGPELPGLSYLTGRLIDRGTARRSADDIAEDLDSRGVSLKVSTDRHALTLSCTCLAEDFEDVLALVADVAGAPSFPAAQIETRRAEAATLLRQTEDNPAYRALDAVQEQLYGFEHPYGRPPKGTAAGVERITRDHMVAFHAARMLPSALTLVVVGDVSAERAVDLAARELERWRAGEPERLDIAPPRPPARRQIFVPMPGKPQADLVYGFTTIRREDPRFYAYWMMNNILGQFGLGGRLADNIRERQGMAYYAYSTLDATMGEAPLLIRAGVDPVNVQRALDAVDHEVAALGSAGPTPREVEETRAYLIGSIPRMLETNQSIAAFLQAAEEFGLGLDFDQRLPALLGAVTLDDISVAAAETLNPDRAAIAIAGPPDAAPGEAEAPDRP